MCTLLQVYILRLSIVIHQCSPLLYTEVKEPYEGYRSYLHTHMFIYVYIQCCGEAGIPAPPRCPHHTVSARAVYPSAPAGCTPSGARRPFHSYALLLAILVRCAAAPGACPARSCTSRDGLRPPQCSTRPPRARLMLAWKHLHPGMLPPALVKSGR